MRAAIQEKPSDRCLLCEDIRLKIWCHLGAVRIVSCRHCDIGFPDPQPDARACDDLYGSSYFEGCQGLQEVFERRRQERLLDLIECYRTPGRLLDVGTGLGLLLEVATARGWRAEGLEPSAYAARRAQERTGCPITAEGTPSDPKGWEGGFDAVTLRHTLEHLDDPLTLLRALHDVTASHGLLFIAVPNRNSLYANWFRGRWFHIAHPYHRWHFSQRSLRWMLRVAGWSVVRMKTTELPATSAMQWLLNGVRRCWGKPEVSLHENFDYIRHPAPLMRWLLYLERCGISLLARLGQGEELVCVAQRPKKRTD